MLSLLRTRSFALLWTGGLVSVAGDWVLIAALPYFVYQATGSTVATAGMIAAELAPSVVLGSIAGVFVDRWDRKRVLVLGNLLQAAVVLLLVVVPERGALWIVYAVAAAQATISTFTNPAETALLPTVIGTGDLTAANALNVLNNRIGRLAGLPLGGAMLAAFGLGAVVYVDAASFVVAAVLIAFVVAPARPVATEDADARVRSAWRAFWRDWRDGLALIRRDRDIALLFVVFGIATFGGTMLDPLTVAWARDALRVGPDVYALLSTVHAAAGIAGALAVARFRARVAPPELIGYASLVAGGALALKYNVPSVPLAFAMNAVGGVSSVASSIGVETLAMSTVSEEFRGRVFGALNATLALLSLSGAVVGGVLGEVFGTVTMLNVASALVAFTGVIALVAFRAQRPAAYTSRH